MKPNEQHAALTRAVADAEQACGAEIVVVGYRNADGYLDVVLRNMLVLSLVALAAVLLVPVDIGHDLVFPIVAGAALLAFGLSRIDAVVKLTSSTARRLRAIDNAVARSFLTRGVHRTRDRIGMLVTWFELEGEVRVLFDSGLEARVPEDVRARVSASLHAAMLDDAQRAAAVTAIGTTFGPFVAHDASADNELADAVIGGAR